MNANFLRCEYLVNPLGIGIIKPRLSWIVESDERVQYQTAYRIIVASNQEIINNNEGDLWDSEKVLSDQTIHVIYEGKPLESEMKCFWKVMVWDKNDFPSEWSEPSIWTMGLLEVSDWKAKWIGAQLKEEKRSKVRRKYHPSPMLRKNFRIDNQIKQACVYVTALGEYELYINGKRVGDHILAPEWTDYNVRTQYQTYDITDLLIEGENVIGVILGDGWYIGYMGPGSIPGRFNCYGSTPRFLLQMSMITSNGIKKEIFTGSDWKIYEDGPIERSDHFKGEIYNAQKEQEGWNSPEYDDSSWAFASVDDSIGTKLVSQMNEPIRIVKEFHPISIDEPKPGVFIFNLGQNIAGWCRIRLGGSTCEPNATVTLRHGEMLNPDGTLYTVNLRSAKATDKIILNGTEEREFQPHFTYHGFQYVEVKGLKPGINPKLDMITACVIASDSRVVGAFESSDSMLNKLWDNIFWTQRDNMISVPTDCPQRDERMGWMGDAQVFSQTSNYNMDMAAFYTKFIQDIRDEQWQDGRYPQYVPFPEVLNEKDIPLGVGSPAWSDAGLIIPWDLYLNYNDKRIIKEHYESAKRFIDFISSKNQNLRWIRFRGANYGDWLNGDTIQSEEYPKFGASIPDTLFSTAYFAHSTELLSKMAKLLGLHEDYEKYSDLAGRIKDKLNSRFVEENGRIKGNTQAGYALLLHFNLLAEKLRPKAAAHLIDAIEKYDGKISTGFCTTLPMMLQLTKMGYSDVAYELLLSRKFPSWFYMIEQGATTMWERWDGYVEGRGFQDASMNSFNHYSIGAVGEWMYRVILGINLDEENPGYKHIILKPSQGGSLSWVKGHYESIHGKIASSWKIEGGDMICELEIPANTTAMVNLPAESIETTSESGKPIKDSREIQLVSFKNNIICIKIGSGNYKFKSKYSR